MAGQFDLPKEHHLREEGLGRWKAFDETLPEVSRFPSQEGAERFRRMSKASDARCVRQPPRRRGRCNRPFTRRGM